MKYPNYAKHSGVFMMPSWNPKFWFKNYSNMEEFGTKKWFFAVGLWWVVVALWIDAGQENKP